MIGQRPACGLASQAAPTLAGETAIVGVIGTASLRARGWTGHRATSEWGAAHRSPKGTQQWMMGQRSVLERAFELARSGRFTRVSDVTRALVEDHYDISQLQGASLRRQLRALVRSARSESVARP